MPFGAGVFGRAEAVQRLRGGTGGQPLGAMQPLLHRCPSQAEQPRANPQAGGTPRTPSPRRHPTLTPSVKKLLSMRRLGTRLGILLGGEQPP